MGQTVRLMQRRQRHIARLTSSTTPWSSRTGASDSGRRGRRGVRCRPPCRREACAGVAGSPAPPRCGRTRPAGHVRSAIVFPVRSRPSGEDRRRYPRPARDTGYRRRPSVAQRELDAGGACVDDRDAAGHGPLYRPGSGDDVGAAVHVDCSAGDSASPGTSTGRRR